MKIKTKNLKYVHINFDGSLFLGYRKFDNDSKKDIDWNETIMTEDAPFKVRIEKAFYQDKDVTDFKYRSIFIDDYILPLINDITLIELWPKNFSDESPYSCRSLYVSIKNGAKIPFNEFKMSGVTMPSLGCKILY